MRKAGDMDGLPPPHGRGGSLGKAEVRPRVPGSHGYVYTQK